MDGGHINYRGGSVNVECYRRRWPTFGLEDLSKQNKGCSISEVEVFLHKYQHADTLFFNYCVVFFLLSLIAGGLLQGCLSSQHQ